MVASSDQSIIILQEVSESEGNAEKVSECEGNVRKVPESEKVSDAGKVSESEGNAVKVFESEGNAGKVTESAGNAGKVPESERNARKVPESGGNEGKVPEIELHERKVSKSEENVLKVSQKEGDTRKISGRNKKMRLVLESDGIMREISDRSKVIIETPKRGEIKRETTHSGVITRTISCGVAHHKISYRFSVLNFHARDSRGFLACFETECQVFPTSWMCEMLFQKAADDCIGCITFKLKRTDSACESVKVHVALDIQDATTQHLFCRPSIWSDEVHPGDLIDGYFIKKYRNPEDASYFNLKLYVDVSISVISCHFAQNNSSVCQIC